MKVICIYSSENNTYSSPVFTDDVENGCKFIINNLIDTYNECYDKAKKDNANEFVKNFPSLIIEKSSYMSLYLVADFDNSTGEFKNDKQLLIDKINLKEIIDNLEKEKKND